MTTRRRQLMTLSVILASALAVAWPGAGDAQPRIQPSGPPAAGPGTPAAPSGTQLLNGTTVEITAEMLTEAGYTDVKIYEARSGNRHVSAKFDDVPMIAMHLHCREDKTCPAVGLVVIFGRQDSIDANYMNAWNTAKLYSRLYKDSDGDLLLQQDIYVRDVPAVYLKHSAQMFGVLLRDLLKFQPGQK